MSFFDSVLYSETCSKWRRVVCAAFLFFSTFSSTILPTSNQDTTPTLEGVSYWKSVFATADQHILDLESYSAILKAD